jgi:hypothetical protein
MRKKLQMVRNSIRQPARGVGKLIIDMRSAISLYCVIDAKKRAMCPEHVLRCFLGSV